MSTSRIRPSSQQKTRTIERHRAAQLMRRLYKCAMGEIELTATQIRAAEVALKKLKPDLKQVEHTGEYTVKHEREMTVRELDEHIERLTARLAGEKIEAGGAVGPDPVH